MWTNCRLLLFTRYPEAGNTKTRLIKELGAEGAALLQKKLTERVIPQVDLLTQQLNIATIVCYHGGSREKMTSWLGPMNFIEQADGDLGVKMRAAFMHAFTGGAEKVVLIGSDIPDISVELLKQAFIALLDKEVVIGPCEDGGYYLIGLVAKKAEQLLPLLFTEMRWSTKEVFSTTIKRLEHTGYDAAILPALRDVDLPTDLHFAKERRLL